MTKEEAKRILYAYRAVFLVNASHIEAFDMAIKALEQQPCEDVISREDALLALTGEWTELTDEIIHRFIKRIKNLPPVTPQQKMGKWLIKRIENYDHAICSICGDDSYLSPEWDALELYKYCPNCGTKMEVSKNEVCMDLYTDND